MMSADSALILEWIAPKSIPVLRIRILGFVVIVDERHTDSVRSARDAGLDRVLLRGLTGGGHLDDCLPLTIDAELQLHDIGTCLLTVGQGPDPIEAVPGKAIPSVDLSIG